MKTTMMGYIRVIVGIMENKMETTIMGYIRVILGIMGKNGNYYNGVLLWL